MLMKEGEMEGETSPIVGDDQDRLFIQSDRIYMHHLLRLNHTTYDVRRSQDVINPGTSRRDIMLLASNPDDTEGFSPHHPFLYARVLGIYHVNVVYAGTGMHNYVTRRLDFVWVRWYEYVGTDLRWNDRHLDSVRFPPMASKHAFGFIDPQDVLRGCHVIPAFLSGRVHCDAISLSQCAKDAQDYNRYCIDRSVQFPHFMLAEVTAVSSFVDRDMVMRYHWGLAIGHIYTHNRSQYSRKNPAASPANADTPLDSDEPRDTNAGHHDKAADTLHTTGHEFLLDARDNDDWDASDEDPINEDLLGEIDDSDVEIVA